MSNKITLNEADLETVLEALSYCVDEGDFPKGSELLASFKELYERLEHDDCDEEN